MISLATGFLIPKLEKKRILLIATYATKRDLRARVLRKLGVDLTKQQFTRGVGKFTQQELMALFLSKLAGEPELVIETAWDASCMTCQETAKKKGERAPKSLLVGMHRFPQLRTGGHDPVIKCAICSSSVRAQSRIVGYHSLETPHNK